MMCLSRIAGSCMVLSLLLGAAGCGPDATSTRQILPSFHAEEMQGKRLLLTPFAVQTLDPDRSVPLETEELEELSKQHLDPDPNRAALKVLYAASAAAGKPLYEAQHAGAGFLEIKPTHWDSYFGDSSHFFSVTLDGTLRYQVPERAFLKQLGFDADFAIVVGKMAYSKTTLYTKSDSGMWTTHLADFEGSFLVWDYDHTRALAEGVVKSSVKIGDAATAKSIAELGGHVIEEILTKRPFRG